MSCVHLTFCLCLGPWALGLSVPYHWPHVPPCSGPCPCLRRRRDGVGRPVGAESGRTALAPGSPLAARHRRLGSGPLPGGARGPAGADAVAGGRRVSRARRAAHRRALRDDRVRRPTGAIPHLGQRPLPASYETGSAPNAVVRVVRLEAGAAKQVAELDGRPAWRSIRIRHARGVRPSEAVVRLVGDASRSSEAASDARERAGSQLIARRADDTRRSRRPRPRNGNRARRADRRTAEVEAGIHQ